MLGVALLVGDLVLVYITLPFGKFGYPDIQTAHKGRQDQLASLLALRYPPFISFPYYDTMRNSIQTKDHALTLTLMDLFSDIILLGLL